jgi:hypothetical protein
MVGLGLFIGLSVNSSWTWPESISTEPGRPSQPTSSGPEPSVAAPVGVAESAFLPAQAAPEGQAMMSDGDRPPSIPSIGVSDQMLPPSPVFSANVSGVVTKPAQLLGPQTPSWPASAAEGATTRANQKESGSLSPGKMPLGAPAGSRAGASSASLEPPPASAPNSSGGRTNFLEFPAEPTPVGGSSGVAPGVDQSRAGASSSQARSSVEYRVLSVPVEGVAMVQTDPQKSVRPIRVGERLPDGSVLKRADVATGKVETSR